MQCSSWLAQQSAIGDILHQRMFKDISCIGGQALPEQQTCLRQRLTALAAIEDKVRAFGFGADDYLTKPFSRNELVARIHAIVRRSKGHAQSVIQTGGLAVDVNMKKVSVNGTPVYLTGKEYKMLELLVLRKGTTITKEMFLNYLYGGMDEPESKIVDVFMCKLRKKLAMASGDDDFIETVWSRRYVLRDRDDNTSWAGAADNR
jgi:two-component system, cell cycle response regulator CtrA